MRRSLEDIRDNIDHVGCDNQTALEMCAEIERLRAALESLTKDPPPTLSREPDTDAEVIIKMRAIARAALSNGDRDG